MTRPKKTSALVLDGSEVKARLLAERTASNSVVHIDWVRFTCLLRNSPAPALDDLFPPPAASTAAINIWDAEYRTLELRRILATLPDADFAASAQAKDLATEVAEALGDDYSVTPEVKKGHDFYRHRWSIERNGVECGWVGYLSSGDSPRQQSQSRTIHCNLYGMACTFAAHGWNGRIASIIEARGGDMTRCDLALDYFDGFAGGMDRVLKEYKTGLCDSGGKRLKCNMVGDWANGHARSFYIGSKEAGKQTNIYEKGDQLFGVETGSKWLRIELRYGNKLRELSPEMLRRPADFFAGASPWHAAMLLEADAIAIPEPVKTRGRLALETVEAEATRSLRWFRDVAAPSCAAAIEFLGFDELVAMVSDQKLPGRLQKFSLTEIRRAFAPAFNRV